MLTWRRTRSRELIKKIRLKIYETMIQPIFYTGRSVGPCENKPIILTAEIIFLLMIVGISGHKKIRHDNS